MLYVKGEQGLCTDDLKKNPDAALIPEARVQELLDSDQDDLVVERVLLEYLERADRIKEIQVINGLRRGQITAALNGEPVGTVIRMARSR